MKHSRADKNWLGWIALGFAAGTATLIIFSHRAKQSNPEASSERLLAECDKAAKKLEIYAHEYDQDRAS
ncbi:MAG: hypothetical protein MUC92_12625 [Fimbriimonadaceae bacterium]|nr:hypothetical protein [Fimbriimonadaceae bacterium]